MLQHKTYSLDSVFARRMLTAEDYSAELEALALFDRLTRAGHASAQSLRDVFALDKHSTVLPALKVLDIGCRTGDFLRRLEKEHPSLELWGLDDTPRAVEFASRQTPLTSHIHFMSGSLRSIVDSPSLQFDVIHGSLFFHRLCEAEAIEALDLIARKAKLGFVLNEALPHPLTRFLTRAGVSLIGLPPAVRRELAKLVRQENDTSRWQTMFEQLNLFEQFTVEMHPAGWGRFIIQARRR